MPITWTDDVEGSFFFWLAKQRKSKSSSDKKEKEKLVVWLNGGPGCSSMVGMFWENGPFHIQEGACFSIELCVSKVAYYIIVNTNKLNVTGDKHSKLKYNLPKNPYSWNEVANVLYVEQPIRTGFAQAAVGAETIRNERQIARDFRNFLISFMKVFPEFKGSFLLRDRRSANRNDHTDGFHCL